MKFISSIDFLLVIVYVFILYALIKWKAVKYKTNGLYRFYLTAFGLHIAGAILYALVIQYYYGYGDSFGFFMGSNFIHDITIDDLTLKYFFYSHEQLSGLYSTYQNGVVSVGSVMNNGANIIVMKISAALSLISFNSYLVVTLFFGLFSFAGLWRLFTTFNEILENKAQRILAITVLYVPSIWFWGSGLIKDSICVGCLGFVVHSLYKIFIQKKFSFKDIIQFFIFFYILFVVKSYIAAALIIAVVFFSIHYFMSSRNSKIEKWVYSIIILIFGGAIVAFGLRSYITTVIEDSRATIDTFKNTYENMDANGDAGSGFAGKTIDFTFGGIILSSPGSIFTTLFRPFPWEIKNLMMSFSSLESLISLLAFLYLLIKTKLKLFSYIFSNPFSLFAFIIIIILSLIIGFTTFNFGTMVRYRIPILPFYSFLLLSVYVKYKESLLEQ